MIRLEQPPPAAHRNLCTDCGISRIPEAAHHCATACQFIKPNYPEKEIQIHGRQRNPELQADELFFGAFQGLWQAALKAPAPGAQWTGITTRIAEKLLLTGAVDAVLTMAPAHDDMWKPVPVLVTDPAELAQCRGMRMGYAPLLALLPEVAKRQFRKLAVIGIPCQIHALRGLESQLQLDELYVIGTPCSDNTSTENFHQFLERIGEQIKRSPSDISYLEFCPDYHVELRFKQGGELRIPFLQLPLSDLPKDFFPLTCRTCVDYTNALSDLTVGYMGGNGKQWLIVRNKKGEQLLELLGAELETVPVSEAGSRTRAVTGFKKNVELAAGGLPLRKMPAWLRPIVGWLMPRIGPRGTEFARARVEMKAIESIVHLRREQPRRIRNMVPDHIWKIAARYGLTQDDKMRH